MTDTALIPSTTTDPDVTAAMVVYERLKPLKEALGIGTLTDGEMQVFAMVCQHTGLDPFTRQIYAIKRGGKVTHQTGIDGHRSGAERTSQYAGSDEATFEACDCGADDSPAEHPKLARVVVHRILPSGHVVHQTGVARWHELKPEHRKPQGAYDFLDAMWWRMPYNQLAKCAEAAGLRKAFPRVLGGVYIREEMEQAEIIEGEARVLPTAAERIAARRAAAEAPSAVEEPPQLPEATPLPSEAPEPSETPTEDEGRPHLSEAAFKAWLVAARIPIPKAQEVRLSLFPDAEQPLDDYQRAELQAALEPLAI